MWNVISRTIVFLAIASWAVPVDAGTSLAELRPYIKIDAPSFALVNVRLIDGTGSAPVEDRTVIVRNGVITWIGPASQRSLNDAALPVVDLGGYTLIPGIVGMHDHLFYSASLDLDEQFKPAAPGFLMTEIAYSAPRLYLAAGVTTIRTTGSMEPYTDLNIQRQIDSLQMPGPNIDVTGPYLQGRGGPYPQMHELTDAKDARRTVAFWAEQGVTSLKAYTHITRDELAAAIDEAHRRRLRVTGHLCSVGYAEATALGIDNLEHGPIFTDTEFVPNKELDVCPSSTAVAASWLELDVASEKVQDLMRNLISHHVAITSTLPVFELKLPGRPALPARFLDAMSPQSRTSYLLLRARVKTEAPKDVALFAKEMQFELAFSRSGGMLLAGADPTGMGGVLPGFGDMREIELLVEAGFTAVEAIHIATANGARYLGRVDSIGTIEVGKRADLVAIRGNPATRIDDIENVEIVFKNGIGYDSRRLIESVRGVVGLR
jgi:imidazolonepropionase-like amidohydrolase